MSFSDLTLKAFLEEVAAQRSAPGAGAVAAAVAGAAAALVAMAARFAGPDLDDVAAQADALRARALELADADAHAYAAVLEASRLPPDERDRDAAISAALGRASDVPLEILDVACAVAALGVRVFAESTRDLRGDAATAVLLAAAAGRSAGELVDVNVRRGGPDPERAARCARLVETLVRAARQVPLGLRHD